MNHLNIDEYILQNYKTKTNAQMAQECVCNKSTISNHRKKLGISATELNKNLREQTEYICSQYGKKTKTKIAKELNCSTAFIKKIWQENHLTGAIKTVYYYEESYFEKINTPQKAYWLGFIAADGNLYRREGHQGLISVAVSRKDIEVLENFKSELKTEKPISIVQDNRRENTSMATLQITSDKMFNDILEKGIGLRKTFDMNLAEVFENIPPVFHQDFLLGYFDGDGSIDISNNTISKSHVRLTGPIKSLEVFCSVLKANNIKGSVIVDKRKYSEPFGSLELTDTVNKYLFLKFIYGHSVECLKRKKELSDELIKRIENNVTSRSENIKTVEEYKSVVLKWGELLER